MFTSPIEFKIQVGAAELAAGTIQTAHPGLVPDSFYHRFAAVAADGIFAKMSGYITKVDELKSRLTPKVVSML
jgi:hypothetical protein